MTKQKPVWRMNTGQGVPSDYRGGYITHCAAGVITGGQAFTEHSYLWGIERDGRDIYAYETNRTEAAKFERVECSFCFGHGKHFDPKGDNHLKCPDCNGTGRMARRIT